MNIEHFFNFLFYSALFLLFASIYVPAITKLRARLESPSTPTQEQQDDC